MAGYFDEHDEILLARRDPLRAAPVRMSANCPRRLSSQPTIGPVGPGGWVSSVGGRLQAEAPVHLDEYTFTSANARVLPRGVQVVVNEPALVTGREQQLEAAHPDLP